VCGRRDCSTTIFCCKTYQDRVTVVERSIQPQSELCPTGAALFRMDAVSSVCLPGNGDIASRFADSRSGRAPRLRHCIAVHGSRRRQRGERVFLANSWPILAASGAQFQTPRVVHMWLEFSVSGRARRGSPRLCAEIGSSFRWDAPTVGGAELSDDAATAANSIPMRGLGGGATVTRLDVRHDVCRAGLIGCRSDRSIRCSAFERSVQSSMPFCAPGLDSRMLLRTVPVSCCRRTTAAQAQASFAALSAGSNVMFFPAGARRYTDTLAYAGASG